VSEATKELFLQLGFEVVEQPQGYVLVPAPSLLDREQADLVRRCMEAFPEASRAEIIEYLREAGM
jgi:hypothetical protein